MYMLNKVITNFRDSKASKLIDEVVNKYGFEKLVAPTLAKYNHETFFILGSGGSINDLSSKQWQEIEKGFSVGMNKWLIHDFVPNAISLEKGLYPELFTHLLNENRIESSKLEFIFYPRISVSENNGFPYCSDEEILKKIRVHSGARIKISDQKSLEAWHGVEGFTLKVAKKLNLGLNVEQKGSVYRLTQFAIGSGFKRIVFCGIDLSNTAYFWEENPIYLKNRRLPPFEIKEQNGNEIHLTEIGTEKSLPISGVLKSLHNATTKYGIELCTSSRKSKLSEFLPVWSGGN